MSLTQALNVSLAGLTSTQADLSVISGNVANANTPGYVDQIANQIEVAAGGDAGSSVDVVGISRKLNVLLQTQLWTETSGGSFADTKAQLYQQLQQIYGTPGSTGAFDSAFNNFTTALQGLSTSPSSYSAQTGVLSAAQQLTQNLNSMSGSIQLLRNQSEQAIANGVQQANQAMQTIAQINQKLSATSPQDAASASLQDQRDQAITQLAQLMNITISRNNNNQISVFTASGLQLVGVQASKLVFDNRGTIAPTALWNVDPAKDGVGTLTLVSPDNTTSTDLIANKSIQSGQLGAYLEMRDQILPQAQAQLDELATQMSRSLSDQTTAGTAATSGSQAGFNIDVGNVLPGNSVQVTYTDPSNVKHTVTIVRVDDPAALPLPNTSGNPNNRVIGVNFTGGMTSIVSQLNSALGSNLQFANPSGTVLQVLNNPSLSSTVNAVSATTTATAVANGNVQLPLFTDGSAPISGAITSAGSQDVGLAGRITVNSAVLANPSALTIFQTAPPTNVGDPTRPNFLLNQLTKATLSFPPTTGIGTATAPFNGTLPDYMSQVTSQQSLAATAATNLQQGQDVVVNALQQRFNSDSGVNIDAELSNLITLQHAYAANARVMTTIQSMFTTLMQIGT
jgi:flagellar hook-associated protein 1 FlgK